MLRDLFKDLDDDNLKAKDLEDKVREHEKDLQNWLEEKTAEKSE